MPAGEKTKDDDFMLFPSLTGGGVIVRRGQIIGARPNGHEGSIIYAEAGPSLYTSLTTPEISRVLDAEVVDKR